MKQLIISIPFSLTCQELEVTDFLKESTHSPQWIGDSHNWIVKNLQCHNYHIGNADKSVITALLENPTWKEPHICAMTGDEVHDVVKNYPQLPIAVGRICGLNTKSQNPIQYRHHSISVGEFNVLCFDDVSGWLDNSVAQVLEDIGYNFNEETGERDEFDITISQKPMAVRFGSSEDIFPITEVQIEKDKIILIYNQDVNIH